MGRARRIHANAPDRSDPVPSRSGRQRHAVGARSRLSVRDVETRRHSGATSGSKVAERRPKSVPNGSAPGCRPQAARGKRKASGFRHQAASFRRRGASCKRQPLAPIKPRAFAGASGKAGHQAPRDGRVLTLEETGRGKRMAERGRRNADRGSKVGAGGLEPSTSRM